MNPSTDVSVTAALKQWEEFTRFPFPSKSKGFDIELKLYSKGQKIEAKLPEYRVRYRRGKKPLYWTADGRRASTVKGLAFKPLKNYIFNNCMVSGLSSFDTYPHSEEITHQIEYASYEQKH